MQLCGLLSPFYLQHHKSGDADSALATQLKARLTGRKSAGKTAADRFQNPRSELHAEPLVSEKVSRYSQRAVALPAPSLLFFFFCFFTARRLLQHTKCSHCAAASLSAFCRHCYEYSQVVLKKCEGSWKEARHDGELQVSLQSLGNNSVNCHLAEHRVFVQHFVIIFRSVMLFSMLTCLQTSRKR